ncbi:hypothetical protein BGW38_001110 [Lunasporangiospora selenospora]|uniref:Dynamin family protein n=1 Tax=Lunasporangiospora selenospora TaxID=979761 RepID=A0A9P6FUJ1_9FUNG|nr:hypothetical protein BGW38_001110 [Lunasporangiospora selenospora]
MQDSLYSSNNTLDNTSYQELIDKVNKVRGYGLNKHLTIPQIAIIGEQSSGKSSVLEAITKLSFPRKMGTCTRFATQVNLRQSTQSEMSAFIDGETEFNEQYGKSTNTWAIHNIVNDANKVLCSDIDISEKVLEITISRPDFTPLTVIDLPGIINTVDDDQDESIIETIRKICADHIISNRTIILAVIPADIDFNACHAIGMAEKYDPKHLRTVPIVTKPDKVEPERLPDLINLLLNKRKEMVNGYLVMKNSTYSDIDITWEKAKQKEEQHFKSSPLWNQVEGHRKGRVNVKRFLGDLLIEHIKNELPQLKQEIQSLIDQCEKEVEDMGPAITEFGLAKTLYTDQVLSLQFNLTALLNGHYSSARINDQKLLIDEEIIDDAGDVSKVDAKKPRSAKKRRSANSHRNQYYVRSWLQNMYEDYNNSISPSEDILSRDKIKKMVLLYKGNELPGFIAFSTFTKIYKVTLDHWESTTRQHIRDMHLRLNNAVSEIITDIVDPRLLDLFLSEFKKFYKSQVILINGAIKDIFEDESTPFTVSKSYYGTFISKRRARTQDQINMTVQKLGKYADDFNLDELTDQLKIFSAVDKLDNVDYNEGLSIQDLELQLTGYCELAKQRIVDNVLLQTIERQMIKRISQYFNKLHMVDNNTISTRLIEPSEKANKRQALHDKIEILEKSLSEL